MVIFYIERLIIIELSMRISIFVKLFQRKYDYIFYCFENNTSLQTLKKFGLLP